MNQINLLPLLFLSLGIVCSADPLPEITIHSDVSRPDIIEINFSGGEQSAAQKMYDLLTGVQEYETSNMGQGFSAQKQGKGIECGKIKSAVAQQTFFYSCTGKYSPNGESLSPTR